MSRSTRAESPLRGRVVFVDGPRRSGTNWIQRILTARPDVAAMPTETYLFSHGIALMEERVQHGTPGLPRTGFAYMPRDAFLDASRDFVDRVFEEHLRTLPSEATHLVERTPWHVYNVGLIAAVYPEAPIVHVIRDGRDVTRSLLAKEWGPDTMAEAAEEWRSSVAAGREAGAGLENYVEITYESLLADPEKGIPELYERVGLDLPPELRDRVVGESKASYNVDPSFPLIGSGKWRTALSPTDLRTFDRIAGPLLAEVGYRREAPPPGSPVEALQGAARAARARARQVRRPRAALDAALERGRSRQVSEALERNAGVVQRLHDELAQGRYAVLDDLIGRNTVVQAVDGGEAWRERGPEGAARLRAALEERMRLLGYM